MLKKSEKKNFVLEDKGTITSKRALHIAEDLSYNFGEDVVVYDVKKVSPFVSYYIVASSTSERRLRALVQTAKEALYDSYQEIDHIEGKNGSEWVLIDCKSIVVQLFTKEQRAIVKFDELYKDVPHKIVVQKEEPVFRRKKREAALY